MIKKTHASVCPIVGLAAALSGNETTGYCAPRRGDELFSSYTSQYAQTRVYTIVWFLAI